MNSITLLGRLTKDPELKYSQKGTAYCRFTLAVARPFNKDETDFINCVAMDKTAEVMADYLRKGKRIAIQGRLQIGSYEKNGNTFYTADVMVSNLHFIDYKDDKNSNNISFVNNDGNDEDFPF